jgi:prepilin-type N-terminal cleavage/methylation domain-containing protein
MVFKPTNLNRSAFTLPELMISVALGLMLLLGAVTFYGFSTSSFVSMTNYTELNSQSRFASDLISRDIRTATSVSSATTNKLVLNAFDGINVTYTCDLSAGTLLRAKGSDSRTLLKGLTSFSFALYQRPTNNSAAFEQFPPATPATAKLVAFKWSCFRRVAGPQNDSQNVEMAMVELRNQ